MKPFLKFISIKLTTCIIVNTIIFTISAGPAVEEVDAAPASASPSPSPSPTGTPPSNQDPTVSLSSPANGTTFTAPAVITLSASADDSDGTISQVDFFEGTTLIGSLTSSPYHLNWDAVPAGSYIITAKATDDQGAVTTSAAVNITVNSVPPVNQPPTISITSPQTGATVSGTVTVKAAASDSDGSIAKVEFYVGTIKLFTDYTADNLGFYSMDWYTTQQLNANGSYTVTAKATDNSGAFTDSAPITFNLLNVTNQPPLVTATADQPSDTLPSTAKLYGTITDDGLPLGGTHSGFWTVVSEPSAGASSFSIPTPTNPTDTTVTFRIPGPYIFRFTANDGSLSSSADIQITVNPAPGVNQPPDVTATADQPSDTLPSTAKLYGTITDDGLPLGGTRSGFWTVVSEPSAGASSFSIPTPQNPTNTTVTYTAPGTYVFKFTANDGALSNSATVSVTINKAPDVTATTDNASVTLPSTTNLFATITDDGLPLGGTRSGFWTVVSEPSAGSSSFSIPTPTNPTDTTVSFTATGIYIFRFTANDGSLSSSADIQITVNPAPGVNQPPGVTATADQPSDTLPSTAKLYGTITDDGLPLGGTRSGFWTVVSEPSAGSSSFSIPTPQNPTNTTVTYTAPGTYVFKFTANDGALSNSATVSVTINKAPDVTATTDNGSVTLPSTTNLFATITDDGLPLGGTRWGFWTVVSEPSAGASSFSIPTPTNPTDTTVTFTIPGTYIFRFTANDGSLSSSADIQITVNPPTNIPPTVSITNPANNTNFTAPANMTLTAAANDSDGTVTKVEFFSGTNLIGSVNNSPYVFTWTGVPAGNYSLTAVATDNQGTATTSAAVAVTVQSPPPPVVNQPPVVDAGIAQTITLPSTADLHGTVTDDGLPNPPAQLTTTWSMVSGPGTVMFGNASSVNTIASFISPGTYVLRLTASDGQLPSNNSDITVTVQPLSPPTTTGKKSLFVIQEGNDVFYAIQMPTTPLSYKMVKYHLPDFKVEAVHDFIAADGIPMAGVKENNGPVYIGTDSNKVIKLNPLDLSAVASLPTIPTTQGIFSCAIIDNTQHLAYFGTTSYPNPGKIIRIHLSNFSYADPTDTLTMSQNESDLQIGVMDETTGFAYFGVRMSGSPGVLVKINMNAFTRGLIPPLVPPLAGWVHYPELFVGASIDSKNGYVYFFESTASHPAYIFQINLSDFTRLSSMTRPDNSFGWTHAGSFAIDFSHDIAYFGIIGDIAPLGGRQVSPADVLKVDLSQLPHGLYYTDPLDIKNLIASFPFLETNILGHAFTFINPLNPSDNSVYFSLSSTDPNVQESIVKFPLSGPMVSTTVSYLDTTPPPVVIPPQPGAAGTKTLLVIHDGNEAYYALNISGAYKMVKYRLPDFRVLAVHDFNSTEDGEPVAGVKENNGAVYIGTKLNKVLKLDSSNLSLLNSLSMPSTLEGTLSCAIIDNTQHLVYFGTKSFPNPGKIIRINLLRFTDSVGVLTLNSDETDLHTAVMDEKTGFGYFGVSYWAIGTWSILKINMNAFIRGTIPAQRISFSILGLDNGPFADSAIDTETPVTKTRYAYFLRSKGEPDVDGNWELTRIELTNTDTVTDPMISGVSYTKVGDSRIANLATGHAMTLALDTANNMAFVGTAGRDQNGLNVAAPGEVFKIDLSLPSLFIPGTLSVPYPTINSKYTYSTTNILGHAFVNPADQSVYFSLASRNPGVQESIVKFSLSGPLINPTTVSYLDTTLLQNIVPGNNTQITTQSEISNTFINKIDFTKMSQVTIPFNVQGSDSGTPRTGLSLSALAASNAAPSGETKHVLLELLNMNGERLGNPLVDADLPSGPHEITWDGRNREGSKVAPDAYLVRLFIDGKLTTTKKMIVLR